MENNCLVTKLKSSVNDENLQGISEIKLFMTKTNQTITNQTIREFQFIYYYGTPGAFRVTGNGALGTDYSTVDESQTKSMNHTNSKLYLKNENYTLFASDRDNLEKIYITPSGLSASLISIDLSELKYINPRRLSDLRLNFCATGNIENLSNLINITYLTLIATKNCYGDITTAFGKMTKLNTLMIYSNINFTGEIHSLAAKQAESRTSGNLNISACRGITLDGVICSDGQSIKINFGSSMVDPTQEEITKGYQIR